MPSTPSAGYVDYDGKIYRLWTGSCQFRNGKLDVEGKGKNCLLKLYGLQFAKVETINELAGGVFGPEGENLNSDPLAEGGMEIGEETLLSWNSLTVRIKKVDVEKRTVSLSFAAEVEDPEWGNTGSIDGSLICDLKDQLW